MNKEILYEILKSESEILSSAEIENIMNEELDKSPQDMDTDLIDLCLEALNTVDEEKLNIRKKKYRLGRILIAAAVFVLAIVITIPVCAKYLSINVPQGIVTLYKDCFNIDISKDEYIADISGQLEFDGVENAVLPKMIFDPETKISSYSCRNDNEILDIEFSFSDEEYSGRIFIRNTHSVNNALSNKKINSYYETVEYYDVNDISVLVFSNENDSLINYNVDGFEYSITLNCDYYTACQIAETL